MHKVMTFDPDTGDGIEVLMHRACPANPDKAKRYFQKMRKLSSTMHEQNKGIFILRDGTRLRAKREDSDTDRR